LRRQQSKGEEVGSKRYGSGGPEYWITREGRIDEGESGGEWGVWATGPEEGHRGTAGRREMGMRRRNGGRQGWKTGAEERGVSPSGNEAE